jgi:hypothetical protein
MFFEKNGQISEEDEAQRFKDLLNPHKSAAAREYLAINEPNLYSMFHTSISPDIIKAWVPGLGITSHGWVLSPISTCGSGHLVTNQFVQLINFGQHL